MYISLGGQLQRLIKDGPHQGPPKFLSIKVLSSRESASVAVDGKTVGKPLLSWLLLLYYIILLGVLC